jgi:pentatricopeptide repeat protein
MLPDPIAYVAALNACSNISRSEEGFKIHNELILFGYEKKLQVETSLIDMYGKCGALDSARYVFERMAHRDVVTWNAIMAACAQNGHGKEAIAFFHEMQKDSVKPDEITFVSLLSACNHMGMVEDGKRLFASMNKDYGLTQRAEHYMYTIDLLSRAGCVEDAQALIDIMPFEKDRKLWQSLLSSYNIHGKLEQGIEVAASMFPVDCEKDAPYILLSK